MNKAHAYTTDEGLLLSPFVGERRLDRKTDGKQHIDQAIRQSKEVADYAVENALYKKALGGDVTAMIFWLKNRKPDKWRDKPQPDEGGAECF